MRLWRSSIHVLVVVCLLPAADAAAAQRHIYWSDSQLDGVGVADIDGANINNGFIVNNISFPVGLDVNSSYIYVANQNNHGIARADLLGGSSTLVTSLPDAPLGLALSPTKVYFSLADGTIWSADLPGATAPTQLWTAGSQTLEVAVDDTYVYWSTASGHSIGRARLDGTGVADPTFVSGISQTAGIAVDANYIYYGNIDAPAVGRVPKGGGTADDTFIPAAGSPWGVTVDDTYIYWSNSFGPHSIGRAKLDGSDVNQSFVSPVDGNFIQDIAVDPTPADFSVAPTSKAFGDTTVGQSSATQDFVVSNNGGSPLNVSNVALAGANANQFNVVSNGCASPVAPASTCTVGVQFRPTALGAANAQLQFTHDATGSPSTVSLSGNGVPQSGAPPAISNLKVSPRKPHRAVKGLAFSFDLSQAAKVKLQIQRKYGRKHRADCKRTTPGSRLKKRCPIYHEVASATADGVIGANKVKYNASSLDPGLYRAVATPSNSNGTGNHGLANFYRPWW